MGGRRREPTMQSSVWSQAGWVVSAGGVLGMILSVVYYRALGPPQLWVETAVRGGSGSVGSWWWFRDGDAGSIRTKGSSSRHFARNLGSRGGRLVSVRMLLYAVPSTAPVCQDRPVPTAAVSYMHTLPVQQQALSYIPLLPVRRRSNWYDHHNIFVSAPPCATAVGVLRGCSVDDPGLLSVFAHLFIFALFVQQRQAPNLSPFRT